MILKFDSEVQEALARGGTFDITGTTAVTNKQYWGFNASSGAVIEVIKGVATKTVITTLAGITAAEVDISAMIVTSLAAGLMDGTFYRADEYIITNIKLTSGTLHCYKTINQISS